MRVMRFGVSSDSGFVHPQASEITSESVYVQRRQWMQRMALAGVSAWSGAPQVWAQTLTPRPGVLPALPATLSQVAGAQTLEKITAYADASGYNNFYEFGTDKSDPARYAHTLQTKPWTVEVEGLVKKPGRFDLESLLKLSPMQERIYRMRCVEGWSMVIPWVGYSLAELIKRVEPLGSAKYVEFITQADPKTMPGVRSRVLDWPYVEGLRTVSYTHLTLPTTSRV